MKFSLIILILVLFISPIQATQSTSTLLAIYIIGSDLEYDPLLSPDDNARYKEAATKDIREMLAGWGDGSDSVDIVVAYGGSQKEGWEGMTVATIDDLREDLINGIIGDSDDAYQGWEDVNMGSEEGVTAFLTYIRTVYPDHRLILILWNHGYAYHGFGRDENYKNSIITAPALRNALKSTDTYADIIGFDACFMANLEFIHHLAPYTRYIIAAEETEPEHGWDYEALVSTLIQDPGISSVSLGRTIIDDYLDNPDHHRGSLTLSLLDLSSTKDVMEAFHTLAAGLASTAGKPGSYRPFSYWVGKMARLGISRDSSGDEMSYMVDLLSLSRIAGEEIPALAPEARRLEDALLSFITYSRHNTPVTQLKGVGVFSPIMADHPAYYQRIAPGTILDLSPEWVRFLNAFAETVRKDTTAPRLIEEPGGYLLEEEGYSLLTDVFYQFQSDGSRIILGQEPTSIGSDGLIPKPEWDGTGLFIGDSAVSSILPVYYVSTNDLGVQLYYAWGVIIQGERKSHVRIDLWYDTDTKALQWEIRPYSLNANGEQEFSRSSARLSSGDQLVVFSRSMDADGSLSWEEAGRITWSDETRMMKRMMPCGEYGMEVVAIDLAGNVGESGVMAYAIPCSS